MIETIETGSTRVLGLKLSGKLHDEDYKRFVPKWEVRLAERNKVRLFMQLEDFHGWDLHAARDDLKFSLKHYSDFERIAMVGDRKWEQWMARFCKPFTRARVKFFDRSDVDAAWKWLENNEDENRSRVEIDRAFDLLDNPNNWDMYPWSRF